MPLDDLVSVIETLQQRIRDHGPVLRENETRTRMALIDPLLTALGWDVSDPAAVTPEYSVSGRWADYALLRSDGQPAATIEAKKLGESLASHRMQMLNYSNASGVEYAGLTDGDHWELYEVFQRGQLEDRRILDVSIDNLPAHELALKLLLLWRPNLSSGKAIPADEPVLVANASIEQEASATVSQTHTSPDWIALSNYNPPGGSPHPTSIRFPDSEERPVNQWHETLTHTVGWLYANGRLNAGNVPVENSTGHRYVVSNGTTHPNGETFGNPASVEGTPFWVNINLNAAQVRRYIQILLNHCGISPDTVWLKVEP